MLKLFKTLLKFQSLKRSILQFLGEMFSGATDKSSFWRDGQVKQTALAATNTAPPTEINFAKN